MRYYDSHNPNTGHQRTIERAKPETVESFLSVEVADRLKAKAAQSVSRPNLDDLIVEIPDVVRWLRAAMVSTTRSDEGGGGGKAQGSKPPFTVACMYAADREVAALAYWCEDYGIVPTTSDGLFVRYGSVVGVCGDNLDGVEELCYRLIFAIRSATTERLNHMATDPVHGLWAVRSQNYANWPELAGYMVTEIKDEPETVQEDALF